MTKLFVFVALFLMCCLAGLFACWRPRIVLVTAGGGASSALPAPAMSNMTDCYKATSQLQSRSARSVQAEDTLSAMLSPMGSARLLVIKAGADAGFWLASNCEGRSLFVESDTWKASQDPVLAKATVRLKSGIVNFSPLELVRDQAQLEKLLHDRYPSEALNGAPWDEVIVFSDEESPLNSALGIFAAWRLAGPAATIFVDACDARVHHAYVAQYLNGDGREVWRMSNGRAGTMCKFGPHTLHRVAEDARGGRFWQLLAGFTVLAGYSLSMLWFRYNALAQTPATSSSSLSGRGIPPSALPFAKQGSPVGSYQRSGSNVQSGSGGGWGAPRSTRL